MVTMSRKKQPAFKDGQCEPMGSGPDVSQDATEVLQILAMQNPGRNGLDICNAGPVRHVPESAESS